MTRSPLNGKSALMAEIIFLHGASSSGKSTLARALQAQVERPFWHVSIDHLRDGAVLPMTRFRAGDFSWSEERARIFAGFHASVAAYADAGNDLILEHILDEEAWADQLKRTLAGHQVLFVGLDCDLQTLMAREQARGDRPLGSAVQDAARVHVGRRYDVRLRSEDGLERNVARVLAARRSARRVSEFADS
ncbi:MAG: AAA family ATPase [Pseudomonadota bacterium]